VTTRQRRGFTMIELMVALTTGVTVGLAAFLLAKVSLGAFQQDARVNNAQHSVLMAMNRLTADMRRAGFMATPDAATDPAMCDPTNLTGPTQDLLIAANVIDGSDPNAYAASPNNPLPPLLLAANNNRQPDRLVLAGNYMTTERLTYRSVNEGATQVYIATDTNAVQRIARDASTAAQSVCRLFPTGRHLRLVDAARRETYVGITACNQVNAGSLVTSVTISYATLGNPLPRVAGVCGVSEGNAGGAVNTVNIIEYSLQQVRPPFGAAELAEHGLAASMGPIVQWDDTLQADLASANGEDTRADLIRREIGTNGLVIPFSGEVVADYVVDFKLRARIANAANSTRLLDTDFVKAAAFPPQRIRALGARLTTRSREPDREVRANALPPAIGAPLDRFDVFPAGANRKFRFARVRTMYSEVNLPNLAQASW